MNIKSLSLACILMASGHLGAATLSNPSFEDGIPEGGADVPFLSNYAPTGWTVWNHLENTVWIPTTSPDWVHGVRSGIPIATDGNYFVALDSYSMIGAEANEYAEAGIRTTMSGLTIGETYQITVDASAMVLNANYVSVGFLDAYIGTAGSPSLVLLQSHLVTDVTVFSPELASQMGTYTFSFQATDTSMELGLRSRISDPQTADPGKYYSLAIDRVNLVPEPSAALLATGAGLLGIFRRRRC